MLKNWMLSKMADPLVDDAMEKMLTAKYADNPFASPISFIVGFKLRSITNSISNNRQIINPRATNTIVNLGTRRQ
jgi:hypothetical protein